jgi:cellulose synthase/poly-beta-1,6-N-acetylglucosamine synthase-like glycosyltransferase
VILFLFWGSIALIIYTYFIFPVLVFLRGLIWNKPYKSLEISSLPSVSLIIAAYNEEKSIGEKLDNVLSLDYPRDQLEVIIASDGSTDRTDAIVKNYKEHNIKLLSLPRLGKASALNAAVAASSGEILVFSDANSIYGTDAIRALVKPFANPDVGGVAGNQSYLKKNGGIVDNVGERSYWDFDRIMKKFQSRAGNVISATGAIYAIRCSLFQMVPEGVTDDFVTSTSVIEQGYRLVFAPDAIAYEPVAKTGGTEFGRKVRVITRGLRAVLVVRRKLLNPFQYGFYAIQLLSHKVLRRLIVFPLLLLFFVNPFLLQINIFYQLTMLGQTIFYMFGLLGFLLDGTRLGHSKILNIPYFFCLVNAATLVATINILRGQQIKQWEPQRNVVQEQD